MTHLLNPNRPLRLAIATFLAFASTLVVLMLLNDDGRAPRPAVPTTFDGVVRPGAGTDAEIARLQAAVRGGAPRRGAARRRVPPEGSRDRRPQLLRARRRRARPRARPRRGGSCRAGRGGGARRRPARLRRRTALRRARTRARAGLDRRAADHGRRAGRARPLRRGRADAPAADRSQAHAGGVRSRVLLPRAARRSRRGGGRDGACRLRRQRRQREPRLHRGRCWATSSSPAAGSPRPDAPTAWPSPPCPATSPHSPGGRAWPPRAATSRARSRGWKKVATLLPLPEYAIELGEAELAAGRRAARQVATSRWSTPSGRCSPRRA